jgi:hypothetical protein
MSNQAQKDIEETSAYSQVKEANLKKKKKSSILFGSNHDILEKTRL